MTSKRFLLAWTAPAFVALVGVACTSSSTTSTRSPTVPSRTHGAGRRSTPAESAIPPESPVPAESNPPGDIPDNTQFVPYHTAKGGFTVRVPEGWARTTKSSSVSFTDKLNTVSVSWFGASSAPTRGSAKSKDVPELRRTERAFTLKHILVCAPSCTIPYSTAPIDVTLPSAHAVVITYYSNSPPNKVTGKQYRSENLRFEFYANRQEAALTLSGPVGSDNVDPWRLVSESFRWR